MLTLLLTGQIFEQSRSSEETDRNVDVSTAKVFVSTMHCTMNCTDEDLRGQNVYISICFSLLRDCSKFSQSYLCRSNEPLPNYYCLRSKVFKDFKTLAHLCAQVLCMKLKWV